jgi:hypothetical protein
MRGQKQSKHKIKWAPYLLLLLLLLLKAGVRDRGCGGHVGRDKALPAEPEPVLADSKWLVRDDRPRKDVAVRRRGRPVDAVRVLRTTRRAYC